MNKCMTQQQNLNYQSLIRTSTFHYRCINVHFQMAVLIISVMFALTNNTYFKKAPSATLFTKQCLTMTEACLTCLNVTEGIKKVQMKTIQ